MICPDQSQDTKKEGKKRSTHTNQRRIICKNKKKQKQSLTCGTHEVSVEAVGHQRLRQAPADKHMSLWASGAAVRCNSPHQPKREKQTAALTRQHNYTRKHLESTTSVKGCICCFRHNKEFLSGSWFVERISNEKYIHDYNLDIVAKKAATDVDLRRVIRYFPQMYFVSPALSLTHTHTHAHTHTHTHAHVHAHIP